MARGALNDSADARVDIVLARNASIDDARQNLITKATGSWQATRVAESTESDDEATVAFSLPGSALDGFVADLRRHPDAEDVQVSLEVDPDQLTPKALGSTETAAAEPVRLEVGLTRASGGGPWVTILGAVFVAVLALVALVMVQRRFGGDADDDDDRGLRRRRDVAPHQLVLTRDDRLAARAGGPDSASQRQSFRQARHPALGTAAMSGSRTWIHTWSAPASRWACTRATACSTPPQATTASTTRSDPPSWVISSSVKPRRTRLLA